MPLLPIYSLNKKPLFNTPAIRLIDGYPINGQLYDNGLVTPPTQNLVISGPLPLTVNTNTQTGTLLVAIISNDTFGSGTSANTSAINWSDSLGNTVANPTGASGWTKKVATPLAGGGGATEIWTAWVNGGASLAANVNYVTATLPGIATGGGRASLLNIIAFNGVQQTTGATGGTQDATGTSVPLTATLTPTHAGSFIVGGARYSTFNAGVDQQALFHPVPLLNTSFGESIGSYGNQVPTGTFLNNGNWLIDPASDNGFCYIGIFASQAFPPFQATTYGSSSLVPYITTAALELIPAVSPSWYPLNQEPLFPQKYPTVRSLPVVSQQSLAFIDIQPILGSIYQFKGASQIFYWLDVTASSSIFGKLDTVSAPSSTATTTTVTNNVVTGNPGPGYDPINYNSNITVTTGDLNHPVLPNNSVGNALRSSVPLNGTYDRGAWTVSLSSIEEIAGLDTLVNIWYEFRLAKGKAADGSDAVFFDSVVSATTPSHAESTTGSISTVKILLPAISFDNEYLFLCWVFAADPGTL